MYSSQEEILMKNRFLEKINQNKYLTVNINLLRKNKTELAAQYLFYLLYIIYPKENGLVLTLTPK